MMDSFYEFKLPNVITFVALVLAYLSYRRDSKRVVNEQMEMHTENRIRLDTLIKFKGDQEQVNHNRDMQVHELSMQTATLGEMAKGFHRRLEMLEDK